MRVLGPIKEVLTMRGLPEQGPIQDGELEIIKDAGIVIDGDLIKEVAPFSVLKHHRPHASIPKESIALPAFIDAHTHACFAGSRAAEYGRKLAGESYLSIAESGGGIRSTMKQTEEAQELELISLMRPRFLRMLFEGVATCEVKSGYGPELKMLHAIQKVQTPLTLVPTCLAAHVPPKEMTPRAYLEEVIQNLLPQVQKEHLARRVDIFIEESAFSFDDALFYLKKAQKMGFAVTVHADQFTRGGARLAAKVKAISAEHLEASTDEDFHLLKNSGVIATVLPGATLGLGMPFAKARAMLDSGLTLVIASDYNPGSAPMGNLLLQAALIGANQKLTMAETLAAITCRAAQALELKDCGIIAPGMRADIAIFSAPAYQEILYQQGGLKPQLMIVRGMPYDPGNTRF